MTSAPARPGLALVTGSAKRIGREIALQLAAAGWDVAVHYRASAAPARDLVEELSRLGAKAQAFQCDLEDETQTAALIGAVTSALGPLRLLVNNASVYEIDDLKTMTQDSWHRHMMANVRAPLILIQAFARQTPVPPGASVVNIIDQRVLKPIPTLFSYGASRATLYALTRTLAQSLADDGIRVNAVGPGPTLQGVRQRPQDFAAQVSGSVLGYGSTPGDVAEAVLYLAEARAVTGQFIAVDGGQHLAWKTADVVGVEE